MKLPELHELPLLPRSYATALLIAFGIVIAPLAVALVHAVTQIEVIAKRGEASVARAAQAGEQSRTLRDAMLAMERAARQARVLGSSEVVDTYARQRRRFLEAAERVAAIDVPPDANNDEPLRKARIEERIADLQRSEQRVFAALRSSRAADAIDALPSLQADVDELANAAETALAREREAFAEHPRQVLRDLAWIAALAVPLALLLAVMFSWGLWRPVRSVVSEIRRLGEGEWEAVVRVPGRTEIARIGPQLDWLRRRLIELDEARIRLQQQVSHDLKTPLAAITEGQALLADELYGPLNERQRAVLAVIERNAARLLTQIDALIRAAQYDQRRAANAPRMEVELSALVSAVLDDHRLVLEGKRMVVNSQLQHALVEGNPEQLRMIVDNLISNAVKFSPREGPLDVQLSVSNNVAILRVTDQGPGVAPGEEELIFEGSARGSAAALTGTPGSGVGLAIARELARHHGGTLRAVPRVPGQEPSGACFVFALPLMTQQRLAHAA
ncbi:MAG TPA: HAMP domain-containing sensor histidine kinase [Burkholderiaceae bacterium]|nr:HAMP domain-containing sensor histidine kinase [Burkholderiaceae bacterium]